MTPLRRRPALRFTGAVLSVALFAPTFAAAQGDLGALVEEPGGELTYSYCTACHSEMIVAQQGLTRERWDKMLEWMVEEQGMEPILEPDRTEILDYLSAHYNTDRPNFPR